MVFMPRPLLRIATLFFALWLPLQGYGAVSELLCLPAQQNAVEAAVAMAMSHAGAEHSRIHDCCGIAASTDRAPADQADPTDANHAASSCCKICVGTALLADLAVSPPHVPRAHAIFVLPSPLPLFTDAPQRPPRAALS